MNKYKNIDKKIKKLPAVFLTLPPIIRNVIHISHSVFHSSMQKIHGAIRLFYRSAENAHPVPQGGQAFSSIKFRKCLQSVYIPLSYRHTSSDAGRVAKQFWEGSPRLPAMYSE